MESIINNLDFFPIIHPIGQIDKLHVDIRTLSFYPTKKSCVSCYEVSATHWLMLCFQIGIVKTADSLTWNNLFRYVCSVMVS